ncbi:hypothetical protein DXG03_003697 [Asterophora parasitica]|uniref:Uncharacterized protein n=1 Tax=Asterophora parasitica TaxID=117018 RepID=A0A9P7G9J3_9AGAR|nr:hypothetical protein DXG03_003697 [Asterophora parasitica]
MSNPFPHYSHSMHPAKRIRRSATAVMAGAFDPRPPRDVLTSLLNGVPPYIAVEKDEEERKARKRERKERDRERKKEKAALRAQQAALLPHEAAFATPDTSYSSARLVIPPAQSHSAASSFWKVKARPTIHIPTTQRSVSITPPPTSPILLPSTPASTPGPSNSSSTSRTSSKRPHTPDDYDYFHEHSTTSTASPALPRPRKRAAVKKGWKGWVEGSPGPSEKLINLDAVPVLQERRTRSGKNFDAIGVGKDGWV